MDVVIRHMKKEDIEQIMAIESRSFPSPWAKTAFVSELQNNLAVYFVALHNEKVVGYAGIWLFLEEAHVTTIAVHPDFRGRGLGRLLMDVLIDYARARGAETMMLEVRPSNYVALSLYKSLGFRQIGRRKNYYSETREDALVMQLSLLPQKNTGRDTQK